MSTANEYSVCLVNIINCIEPYYICSADTTKTLAGPIDIENSDTSKISFII